MRCPNRKCRAETQRAVYSFDRNGKKKAGCLNCIGGQLRGKRERVRTGKKVWHGYEAYGVEKTIEMNHAYGERLAKSAAKMRRQAHHSRF